MIAYTRLKCSVCALSYGVDKVFMDHRKNAPLGDRNREWTCPNGHYQQYATSAFEDERQRRRRAERLAKLLRDNLHTEKRRASAYKGHVTRLTKKVREGVCPACEQTFPALEQHMKEEHPDWDPVEVGE